MSLTFKYLLLFPAITLCLIKDVNRQITVINNLVYETTDFDIISSQDPIPNISLYYPRNFISKIAFFEITENVSNKAKITKQIKNDENDKSRVVMQLNIPPETTTRIGISVVYSHLIQTTERILQKNAQPKFEINLPPFESDQSVVGETVKFHFKTKRDRIISAEGPYPSKLSPNRLNVEFLSSETKPRSKEDQQPFHVIFKSSAQFKTAISSNKTISISHWGTSQVHEDILIRNTGGKFSAPYSTIDLHLFHGNIRHLTTSIPRGASNVAVKDVLGWHHNFKITEKKNSLSLRIKTRFPLLGGWETSLSVSYNLPTNDLITEEEGLYQLDLSTKFLFRNFVVDRQTISVNLPDGSSVASSNPPDTTFNPLIMEESTHYSFLSFLPAKTIRIRTNNVVDQSSTSFILNYRLASMSLYLKPLILTFYFAMALICYSVVIRLMIERREKVKENPILTVLQRELRILKRNVQKKTHRETVQNCKALLGNMKDKGIDSIEVKEYLERAVKSKNKSEIIQILKVM